MNEVELLDRLARTDIYPASTPLPEGWAAGAHLDELERRTALEVEIGTGDTGLVRKTTIPRPRRSAALPIRRRSFAISAAAIAIAIGVLAAAALIGDRTDLLSVGADETIDAGEALETAESVFAALNAGDPDGVIAEFTPNASILFKDWSTVPESVTLADWSQSLVWLTSAGTHWSLTECAVTDEGDGTTATVACRFTVHFPLEKAVGAPPSSRMTTMVITTLGVREWVVKESEPGEYVYSAFASWMFAHHPQEGLGIRDDASLEEIRQNALLLTRYAEEWAAFLEAHDCTYPSACFYETPATAGV